MIRRLLVLAVAAALTGCGLPTGGSPHRVNPTAVPFGLLDTRRATTPLPASGPTAPVFFVRGDRLVAVRRHVTGINVPENALRLMLQGPTTNEEGQSITTDVPSQTRLISLDVHGEVATVDLSSAFGSLGGSEQVLAVAQIVYTLTASRYIDAVTFSIDGHDIETPDGNGSLAAVPRRRDDYRRQAPAR